MPDDLIIPVVVTVGALLTVLSVYLLRRSRVRLLGVPLRIAAPVVIVLLTAGAGWYLQENPDTVASTTRGSETATNEPVVGTQTRLNSLMSDGAERLASGDPDGAIEFFGQAATLAIQAQDMQYIARIFTSLADCYVILGDIGQARKYYRDQALPIFTDPDISVPRGEALVLRSLGDIERKFGDPDSARVQYERAREISINLQDAVGEAIALHGLGSLELARGNPDSARVRLLRADTLLQDVGHVLGSANVLHALGDLELGQDQDTAAERYYTSALLLARQVGVPLAEANALYGLGNCAIRERQYAGANDFLSAAKVIYDRIGNRLGQANVATSMGDLLADQDQKAEALEQYRLAWGLYRNLKSHERVQLLEAKQRYLTRGQSAP